MKGEKRVSLVQAQIPLENRGSLRRNLTLLFVVLSLISMGAVAWVSFRVFEQCVRNELTENLSQIVKDKAMHISTWIAERKSDAQVVSESPMVVKRVEVLINPTTVPAQRRDAANDLKTFLNLMKNTYDCYEELSILNQSAEYLVTTGTLREKRAPRGYMQGAIEGQTVVTDIHISPCLNRPTMLISAPIRSRGGKTIGVFEEKLNLNTINKIVQDIKVGRTGESYLVNREGYFITESKFEPGYTLKKRVSTKGVNDCLRGNNGVGEYEDYRGETVIGAYHWIESRGWALMAEQDRAEAFERIYHLRDRMVLIGGVACLFVVLVAFQLSRAIVGKLETADRELVRKQEELINYSGKLAAIGEMAQDVAHEINNPLTTIKSLIYSFHNEFTPEDPRRRDTEIILDEIDKVNTLTLRSLQFARPKEPELSQTDLNQILDKVVLLFESQISSQGIEVIKDLDPNLPMLMIDPHQIGQAFVNLIMNSVQAMPEGGTLRISTRVLDAGRAPLVEVSVGDTGPGIPDSVARRVFDPFFTTKTSGTGLGLAITKGIVEKHKGKIAFETGPGRGTAFSITLPIHIEGHG